MAMTAKFLADWTSFYDAVDKGTVKIVSFQDGARNAEGQLNRMVDNFSGRRIIQEATVMAEAVERVGGTSKFTMSELERMSRVASEAAAKMKVMGVEVPPAIQELAGASTRARVEQEKLLDAIGESGGRLGSLKEGVKGAGASVDTLRGQYQQFDNILQAGGININKYAKGLFDITEASGKTASQLGLVATAGLAAGAAMAGWNIGRWIAGVFELDQKIAGLVARLMNWGDIAAETAGAKQDVINRAIANGAAATISYTDAIKFNIEHQQKQSDAFAVSAERIANAQREVRGLSAAKIAAIEQAKTLGVSTEVLTRHFAVSADALKVLEERQKAAADAAAAHQKQVDALNKAYQKLMSDTKNANQLALMEAEAAAMQQQIEQEKLFADVEIKARLARQKAANDQAAAEAAAEEARIAANQREIDALLAAGQAHKETSKVSVQSTNDTAAGWQGVTQQIEITGDAVREWGNLMVYTAKANAILGQNSLFTSQSQREQLANLRFEGRATGGPVSAGVPYVVGENGPEIMVPRTSGTVVPNGGALGGGASFSVQITAGTIISTREEMTAMVRTALVDFYREVGLPLPAETGLT